MKKRNLFAPLALTFLFTLMSMSIYEILKQSLNQKITIWESHIITIIFSSVLATVVAYCIARKRQTIFGELSKEMADRETAERALQQLRDNLEERIMERTDELNKIAQDLNFILENAPVGISKIIDRKQVLVNRKTEEMFQYPKAEMEFQATRKLYPSDEAYEKLGQEAYPLLAQGQVFETVQELIRKDGVHIMVKYTGKAVEPPDMSKGTIWMLEDITERMRTEELLRRNEYYQRSLLDNFPFAVWLKDTESRFLTVNAGFVRTFGANTVGELIGKNDFDIAPRDMAEGYRADDQEVMATRQKKNLEEEILTGGTIRWFETYKAPVMDDSGELLGTVGFARDITEHKLAEELARNERIKLDSIVSAMTSGLTIRDRDYQLIYQSPYTWGIFGNRIGEKCYQVFQQRDTICEDCPVESAFLDGQSHTHIAEVRMPSGDICYFENIANPIRDASGAIVSCLEITTDITERKNAEELLRNSEARFRMILQDVQSVAVQGYGPDGTTQYWNLASERLYGYSAQEAIGKNLLDLIIPPEMRGGVEQAIQQMAATGIPIPASELSLMRKDGSRVAVFSSHTIVHVPGRMQELFCIDIDLTERMIAEEQKRSLEERLQRSEKMEALGQLAGGVAHDLNNVLGVLNGYSELLLNEIPEGSRSRGYVDKILQSTEKGAAIIQDLLTMARRGVTVSDTINLNSLVPEFLRTPVFENIKDHHPRVTFRTECDENLLNLKGSPVHLEKTLMNLVSNAAEAIEGEGEVTIRTESRYLDKPLHGYDEVKEGDYAVLTVSDTGTGITAEHRERIFEPFFTKKTMGRSGTGLGLAIVWGTVKDHNGYIDVETEVGKGTTFTLYFPGTREQVIAPQQQEPTEHYLGHGESVLVVDDIAEQREIASQLLTRLGYEVHLVASGEEAVEYLKGHTADILILDMIMAPGIDGLETYQRVLAITPQQKAILVSGFSETDRVKEAQKLGAGAYVKKPYVMEKIGVAIRDELRKVM